MWCLCKNGELSAHKVVTTTLTKTWVQCSSHDCPYMEGYGSTRKHTKAHFDGNKIIMGNSFVYLLIIKKEKKGQRQFNYIASMLAVQNNTNLPSFKKELREKDPEIDYIHTCENLENFTAKIKSYATEAAIISEEFESCRV